MNGNRTIPTRPMPVLADVRPLQGLCVEVTWKGGARVGRRERVDLSPLINSMRFYRPLRTDRALFEDVAVGEDGYSLVWQGGLVDMAATSVERLAEETMSAEDIRLFIGRMSYTHETAAAMLGYSRRQIENFLAGAQSVPRVCALACLALESRAWRATTPSSSLEPLTMFLEPVPTSGARDTEFNRTSTSVSSWSESYEAA